MSRIPGIVVVTALLVAASSCGGGLGSGSQTKQGPPPPGTPTSVVVTPSAATIYPGMTAQFQAQVMGPSDQTVAWSVDQGAPGTIDGAGLYTAPLDANGGGFFHVLATSQATPSATGSAAVTILPPQVTIAPASVTLAPGGTQTFTATVRGLASTNVTWTVQQAGGGSISGAGVYSSPGTSGFYHVVATSATDATVSGSATVTVTTSAGRFTPTSDMHDARSNHISILLPNGKVLVAGGEIRSNRDVPIACFGGIHSAELYDPITGSFTKTGDMLQPRYAHTGTLLSNGQVLVTGGIGNTGSACEDGDGPPAFSSAELYDPSTGSFKDTGGMAEVREGHTATLLANGKVLVAGGAKELGVGSKTAELYDPATGVFTSTGSMATPRFRHTATLLANGRVLIAGGVDTTDPNSRVATAKAEIYDPTTGAFTPANNMAIPRVGHTATLLASGRVLIAGGSTVATAELYDPTTSSFSSTGTMEQARSGHTATLLTNGTVLVTGGSDSTAELFDPSTHTFSTTGGMEATRSEHSATLLSNGKVLVAGGGRFPPLATAELFK